MKLITCVKNLTICYTFGLLASCATVATYQSDCEKQHSHFSAIVQCLKKNLHNDPRYHFSRDSDLAKLYVAAAEKLSYEIQIGKISEFDARIILDKVMVELKSKAIARNQQAMENYLMFLILMNSQPGSNNSYFGTHVNDYYRNDGTYVRPHYRSRPNSTTLDNWSTRGNVNPYTGVIGTHSP